MKNSILLKIVASLFVCASWANGAGKTRYQNFSMTDRFQCELSRDWVVKQDKEQDEKDAVFGVQATAPQRPDAPAALIAVEYYSPDNRYFKSAEELIKHYRKVDREMSLSGPEMGAVQSLRVGKYAAKKFEQKTSYPFPANSINARKITVRKEYVLIPRQKGFFLLRYSAPAQEFEEKRSSFDRVLRTFSTPLP